MLGIVCQQPQGVRVHLDLPVPSAGAGETVLKVRVAGICDTDLQLARGYLGFTGILGHEFVAETPAGNRVTAEINNACGQCEICLRGPGPRHCPQRTVTGIVGHDGAMAQYVAVPTANLHAIPDRIPDRRAVFVEPLAAALHICEQVGPLGGRPTAILGDGKLGLLCCWALSDAGASVTWIGKHPEKLALGGSPLRTMLLSEAHESRTTYDLVVDCTGSSSGLDSAIRLTRPRGTLVLKTTVAANYEIDLASIVINEIELIGSRCGPFEPAIQALGRQKFDVERLIEAEFSLADGEVAFRAAARPGARKVLLWNR